MLAYTKHVLSVIITADRSKTYWWLSLQEEERTNLKENDIFLAYPQHPEYCALMLCDVIWQIWQYSHAYTSMGCWWHGGYLESVFLPPWRSMLVLFEKISMDLWLTHRKGLFFSDVHCTNRRIHYPGVCIYKWHQLMKQFQWALYSKCFPNSNIRPEGWRVWKVSK